MKANLLYIRFDGSCSLSELKKIDPVLYWECLRKAIANIHKERRELEKNGTYPAPCLG